METVLSLLTIVVTLACASLMSAASASVMFVTRGRARRLVESEKSGAPALEELLEQPSRALSATSLALALSYVVVTVACTIAVGAFITLPVWGAGGIGGLAAVVLVFVFGEALPRTLAVQNPEGVALASAPLAKKAVRVLYPAARVLGSIWRWGMRLAGGERAMLSPWSTEDEFRSAATDGDEEAARDEAEEAILDAVADFTGKIVREVMVPRTDMECLADSASVAEAVDLIERAGYSRLPVYHDTVDDIRGVLYAKDLLLKVGRGQADIRPADLARPAFFVPETKPVEELLLEMRTKAHIAIVADEYGGTAGLVTIEDLLEEIVGEIFDEYDSQVSLVIDIGDGRFRVDARLPVDDLNELVGTAIESEADTVAGLFAEFAGHIPVQGESLELEGLRLVVDQLEGTRVRQLIVESATETGLEESADE